MDENTKALIDNVWDATKKYFQDRSAAFLLITPEQPCVGSAVCIEIGGRLFIATAAHNFKKIINYTLCAANTSTDTPIKIINQNYGTSDDPDIPDVAWLEIDRESASMANLIGASLEFIDPRPILLATETYLIGGFPAARKEFVTRPNGQTDCIVPLIMYGTNPLPGIDLESGDLRFCYQESAISPDGPVLMTEAFGMSGGGIWYIPKSEPSSVWSLKPYLIGIGIYFTSHEISGIRIYHWLQMLYDDIPEIRQHLAPLLEKQ